MVPLHEIYERLSQGFGVFVWAWRRNPYESAGARVTKFLSLTV
jgi:hypothetical protein